jgi:CheY-like chemotaxis protein
VGESEGRSPSGTLKFGNRASDNRTVPHTLLLADDSVTIQRVIELTFADEDVEVLAVSDGEQAIAAVDQRTPDIVLADVGMPGRDGYEVAQHIKNTPRLAHIPVVLLTGAFEPIDQARAAAVGCDGVLAKPFEPQLVIGRVKELLSRRPSAGMRAEPLASPELPAPAQPKTHRLANEEYFEELDQAFATLTAVPKSPARHRAAEDVSSEAIDWFSRPAPAPHDAPAPVAIVSPQPAPAAPTPPAATPPPAAPVAPSQPAPAAFPPLADAFAALLAAEQKSPAALAAPVWPAAAPPAIAPSDLVDQVTRRVLEQMSERTVRETVADMVSQIAERLVREEIERIKKSIS